MVPPKQLDPTEQDALVKQIGLAMLRAAPEDWDRVSIDYRAVGRYAEVDGEIVYSDDEASDWPVPPDIVALFAQLRSGMYRDGRGTWFNATYRLDHPSSYNLDYDRDEPEWRQPPPPQAYADDLQTFPRTPDNIPEWLLRRVNNQPAPLPGPGQRFRVARIFDGQAGNGKPLVNRPTVPERDRGELLDYLNAAPVVNASRAMEIDRLDPEGRPVVPVAFHTDGIWIWPAAVNFYLHNYGISPELELVEHIRRQGFHVPDVDEGTRAAAAGFLGRGGPVGPPPVPGPGPGPMRPPVPANPPLRRPPMTNGPLDAGGATRLLGDGLPPPLADASPGRRRLPDAGLDGATTVGPPPPLTDASPGRRRPPDAGLDGTANAGMPPPLTDASPGRRRLPDAGLDGATTVGPPPPLTDASPGRRRLPDAGLDGTANAGMPPPPLTDASPRLPDPAPDGGRRRLPGDGPPDPSETGRRHLVEDGSPRLPDPGPPPAVAVSRPSGPPPAALPSQGPPAATIAALRSRLDALGVPESAYRIGPPTERSWTMDQTPDGWRVGWYDKEFVAPAMFEDVADAAAFLIGKIMLDNAGRRPAAEPVPAPPPPPEPAPAAPEPVPVQVPVSVPAAAELTDEATVRAGAVGQAAPRDPEPQPTMIAPAPAPAEPEPRRAAQPGQRWPILPMSGEPPLTLFRGKRMLELAPGTEIDRFGNPDGNLTYAAGTPFTDRSLVPEWIERPYHVYRVEHPTQALSGEAIPWFEQAGGGTAYLLPDAIEDMLADGRLTELPGRQPPMG